MSGHWAPGSASNVRVCLNSDNYGQGIAIIAHYTQIDRAPEGRGGGMRSGKISSGEAVDSRRRAHVEVGNTTNSRAFAADLLQMHQNETIDSLYGC